MTTITSEKLVQAKLADATIAIRVAPYLDSACSKFGIDTGIRIAGFLSQCSHESCGFRVTKENLNYGASALLSLFPKHFDAATAAAYAHQQERIANRIYGGRMGNGVEATGDGWKYRGRGYIQLSGKDDYAAFDTDSGAGGLIVSTPDLVVQPDQAALSGGWFWKKNDINRFADVRDVVGMTKAVNNGLIGLDDREKLWSRAIAVFVS
jgi:putative chitinase